MKILRSMVGKMGAFAGLHTSSSLRGGTRGSAKGADGRSGLIYFRKSPYIRNFGDESSQYVVRFMSEKFGLQYSTLSKRLLAVGSILHMAQDGDTIWGTGVNGKVEKVLHRFQSLDVRAVRGPVTRDYLAGMGIQSPEVYGDPGMMISSVFPPVKKRQGLALLIPNYNDFHLFEEQESGVRIVSPFTDLKTITELISSAEIVFSSSLHGLVFAEAYGVPAVLLLPAGHAESIVKYEDYYYGSGRRAFPVATSLNEALRISPVSLPSEAAASSLVSKFPKDLFC